MEKMDVGQRTDAEIAGFQKWLEEKELSNNTIDSYLFTMKEFMRMYGTPQKSNFIKYKRWLVGRRKLATINLRINAINRYCEYAGMMDDRLKQLRTQRALSAENVISLDEFKGLTESLKEDGDERGYFIVAFLAKTGARASEFVRLNKEGLSKGYCEMWNKGKIRRIYLPESLINESKNYFESVKGDLLFPNRYGKEMTTRGLAGILNAMQRKYGIRKEVMHPHSFRHFFAIHFLENDNNISLLSRLMGHSNISTTAIYTNLSENEQKARLDAAMRGL